MTNPERPGAREHLLALLCAGEHSAHVAFSRLGRRLPPQAAREAQRAVAEIAREEAWHERCLRTAAASANLVLPKPPASVRRFFVQLESRDIGVHLTRVAALDGMVCQTLAAVLQARDPSLTDGLFTVLAGIRRDEGRHVRVARRLARDIGLHPGLQIAVAADTRHAFDRIVEHYEFWLADLGVDTTQLRRRLRRDGD